MRIIIVGAGLAGMAAAVALESAGAEVTLIEARRSLGGRAGSFVHPETDETLDNCQHVLLGCCTNLIDFYHRLGVLDRISFERTIHFLDEQGRQHDLWGLGYLPAPLHLAPAMLSFAALNNLERLSLSQAMMQMMLLGLEGRRRCADQSFGQWLAEQDQPASLIEKIYQPLITGALNEDCSQASAEYAIQVFQDSLLSNSSGYLLGLPKCALGELYAQLPCRNVRFGTRAAKLIWDERRRALRGVELTDGQILSADAVVLATNYDAAERLVDAKDDLRVAMLTGLSSTPILGAHLFFDRPVMETSHAAFLGGPLQWLFKKDEAGRAVHGVISAAGAWVNRNRQEMAELFASQVRRTLPLASQAKLLRHVIVIEKRATFAPVPGVDRFRPEQAPGKNDIENLFLAGDYTRTGWPATMEGAVRGGYLAAEALLARYGKPSRFLVHDLPMQWPAQWAAFAGKM